MFPQIFGKYVLERELASGGMARVYLAMLRGAVGFEKRLVVKQIRPELASDPAFVRRFVEEAKTTVELSHPNIVPVYELGVEQGVYYIAMELCSGVTLAEVLKRSGRLSPEEGAYLGVEVCRALDYAHRRAGIIHRDVTPRNVLIDEEGAVRLIDFGIAAPAAASGAKEVFGSPGHMAPEQLAGLTLTPAADVFAAAVLLFEAWTGRPAFRRATARESAEAVAAGAPALDVDAPELSALSPLIASGLARNPSDRPAGAEAFARPLRDFLRSVDSGDIARRLGARVQKAQQASARAPASSGAGASADDSMHGSSASQPDGRDSRPSSEPTATRTFAAREEVSQWTRRLESERPAAAEGSRSASQPNTPTMAHSEASPAPPSKDALPPTEREVRPAVSSNSRRGVAVGGALLAALVAVGASLRHGVGAPAANPVVARPNQVSAAPAKTEATTLLAATPPATPAAVLTSTALASASTSAPPPHAVDSASFGKLRLTADPAARVSIQGPGGTRALTTPVRDLRLAKGTYVITFRSDTYSAPLVATVSLAAGGLRRVHADFREVNPRLSVE